MTEEQQSQQQESGSETRSASPNMSKGKEPPRGGQVPASAKDVGAKVAEEPSQAGGTTTPAEAADSSTGGATTGASGGGEPAPAR